MPSIDLNFLLKDLYLIYPFIDMLYIMANLALIYLTLILILICSIEFNKVKDFFYYKKSFKKKTPKWCNENDKNMGKVLLSLREKE